HSGQKAAVPLMSGRVFRIEFDCAPALHLRAFPVPIEMEFDDAERAVRFGERIVDLKSLHRRGLRFRKSLSRRKHSISVEKSVTVGQPGISQSVTRIGLYCGFESLYSFLETSGSPFIPVVTPLEIELIGFVIFGVTFRKLKFVFAAEPQPQLVGDL